MKRVTIKEVAKSAGVSTTTVSHVINNTRKVNEPTRQRVLDAMRDLNFQPNSVARGLRRGETKTIGLIVPDVANLFFAEISRQIENIGYQQGYSVILCNSDNNLEKQGEYINTLMSKLVDGVIFISAGDSSKDLQRLSSSGIPVVVADREVPLSLADVVILDNEAAGYTATRHLINLGHEYIGCITGPQSITPSMRRVDGYKRALADAGINFNPDYVISGNFQFSGGRQAMTNMLRLTPRPTAVFVLNDMMAIGAMTEARRFGLRVPEDLSFVGFDDIEMATAVIPALTTLAQPIKEMGAVSIELLIRKMQRNSNEENNRRVVLQAELVVRESTQKVRDTHG